MIMQVSIKNYENGDVVKTIEKVLNVQNVSPKYRPQETICIDLSEIKKRFQYKKPELNLEDQPSQLDMGSFKNVGKSNLF